MFRSRKGLSYSYPQSSGQFNSNYADLPLKKCILNIPVTQTGSGTPAPDNIRDFIGVSGVNVSRTGKNIFNKTTILNNYFISGNTGLPVNVRGFYCSDFIPVKPNITYTTNTVSTGVNKFAMYDSSYSHIKSSSLSTYTMPSNCTFIRINGNISEISADDVMVVEGSELPSAYEPYTGNTYPITFGQTVYSANLDVLTGKLYLTHEYQTYNGSEDWRISSTGNNYYIEIGVNAMIDNTIIANEFESIHRAPTVNYIGIYNTSRFIQVRPSAEELDVQAWKTWLNSNNLKVVYELAEPIEISLGGINIKTLQGTNNIFADVGTLDIQHCNIS